MSGTASRLAGAERIFREVMGLGPQAAIDAVRKEELAAWDSLRHAELVIRLQKDLGIRLTIEEIQGLSSVSALREIVARKA